ncbi:MAG: DMT family transporter, partial [Calditrichaeota bacterium]|nr:DMT family transporter [Calditrichota bacterium]
ALKILYTDIEASVFTVLRFIAISVLASFSLIILVKKSQLKQFKTNDLLIFLSGGFFAFCSYQYFLLNGISRTPIFLASVLISISPLFAVIFSAVLKIEKASWNMWVGTILALFGIAIFKNGFDLTTLWQSLLNSGSGELYCLGSAVSWASYTMITKHQVYRDYKHEQQFAFSVIFSTLILFVFYYDEMISFDYRAFNLELIAYGVYTVIFPIFLAYKLYNKAVQTIGVERTIIYIYLVPILSGLIAALMSIDTFTGVKLLGSVIVIAGVILAKRR